MKHIVLTAALALAACAAPIPPVPVLSPPPPPPPGLASIVGASVAEVTARLGTASLDRSEGPGRQLVFVRPACVLDVFFYPGAAGSLAVRTASSRRPDGTRMDPAVCLTLITPPIRDRPVR